MKERKNSNIVGLKFNMLLVLEQLPNEKGFYKTKVRCVCDCGKETIVEKGNVSNGHTKSCGCLSVLNRKKSRVTHGMTHTTEYKSFIKMRERCYYVNDINYHNYGGRGVTVCSRWRNSFENFIKDMGIKPTPKHSIERIDVNGNYEPSNCKWATKKEQLNNTTKNVKLEYNGEIMNQIQWAEKLNVPYGKILRHLKNGFSFSEIVDYILKNGGKKIKLKPEHRRYYPRKK